MKIETTMAGKPVNDHDRRAPAPPPNFQKPLNDVFSRVAKSRRVVWPPQPEPPPKEVAPPPEIELMDSIAINEEAMFQNNDSYHLCPSLYAEDPDAFGDVWPPPCAPDLSEKVIYDESRKKRVHRDFEVQPSSTAVHKSYKIAPGTLHVFMPGSQQNDKKVLQFNYDNVKSLATQEKDKDPQEQ